MGTDIRAFVEVESSTATSTTFTSLFRPALYRNSVVFAALGHPHLATDFTPLFPLRGLPQNLGNEAFFECYKPIVQYNEALDWRGHDFILNYEVGRSTVFQDPQRDGRPLSKLGYVLHPHFELASWLTLSEIHMAIQHAGISFGEAVQNDNYTEHAFLFDTMANAERYFGHKTRLVFGFDQ